MSTVLKIWSADRAIKKALIVQDISIQEALQKGCQKLGYRPQAVRLVLESDGTEVEDDDTLAAFAGQPLLLMTSSDEWYPAPGAPSSHSDEGEHPYDRSLADGGSTGSPSLPPSSLSPVQPKVFSSSTPIFLSSSQNQQHQHPAMQGEMTNPPCPEDFRRHYETGEAFPPPPPEAYDQHHAGYGNVHQTRAANTISDKLSQMCVTHTQKMQDEQPLYVDTNSSYSPAPQPFKQDTRGTPPPLPADGFTQRARRSSRDSPQSNVYQTCQPVHIPARDGPYRQVNPALRRKSSTDTGSPGRVATPPLRNYSPLTSSSGKPTPPSSAGKPREMAPPAPDDFQLVSMHQRAPPPLPQPPRYEERPFDDPAIVFADIDKHAQEVADMDHWSFRDLVYHLIFSKGIHDDLEKARAVFMWLCRRDIHSLEFEDTGPDSPEAILDGLKRGKSVYAEAYEVICRYSGLYCKMISGYAKGADYKPGMAFERERGRHHWNAVYVYDTWRLVDCGWAARQVITQDITPEYMRYRLDEFYFMTPPSQLIFSHFPFFQRLANDGIEAYLWQLLERPIRTLPEFQNQVALSPQFFKYGLHIPNPRQAVVHCNRTAIVTLGFDPSLQGKIAFNFSYLFKDGRNHFNGVPLIRFGLQEVVDNVCYTTVRPPYKGPYILIIYAREIKEGGDEALFADVCEYEIFSEESPMKPHPFPPCSRPIWGPGERAHIYDIEPLQKGAQMHTINGRAEIKFRHEKSLRMEAELRTEGKPKDALQGYVSQRIDGEYIVFTVQPPNPGEYGLEIFVNDPVRDGNSMFHVYQYLILCKEKVAQKENLPNLPPGFVGPQAAFTKFGIETLTHSDPTINTRHNELQVAFRSELPLRMTSKLTLDAKGHHEKDCSPFIMQQMQNDTTVFVLRMPRVGLYKFSVFAQPDTDSGNQPLEGIYNYLINCHAAPVAALPFPRQYRAWKENHGFLYSPMEGSMRAFYGMLNLEPADFCHFKVNIPNAEGVAVVCGQQWVPLEMAEDGTWQGDVNFAPFWGNVKEASLCASIAHPTSESKYTQLLDFVL